MMTETTKSDLIPLEPVFSNNDLSEFEQITVSNNVNLELIYSELQKISAINEHIMYTNDFFVYGLIPIFTGVFLVSCILRWFWKRFIGI